MVNSNGRYDNEKINILLIVVLILSLFKGVTTYSADSSVKVNIINIGQGDAAYARHYVLSLLIPYNPCDKVLPLYPP